MDVLRLSSQKGLFLQRSQCSRLRENTAFKTIIRTILHGMPVNAINPTPLRLEVKQRLAEMAHCKTSASAVVSPRKDSPANAVNSTAARCSRIFDQDSSSRSVCQPARPLPPREIKKSRGPFRRVSACASDVAEPRFAKRIAESDICKRFANACASAECKNQVDENSAEDALREVFASAVLFVVRKLAEQQPGRHCSRWFPVRSSPRSKRITQPQRLVAAPVPGRYRGSTNPGGGDERAALPVVGVASSVLHKARCVPV
jgi:hypothetical protein